VRRTLSDPAVGDDLLVGRDALRLVELAELVGRLERAVVVGRLRPGDVGRAADVSRHLRLLLRQVVRGELLAPVLLRRPDVDEADVRSDLREHLVSEGADLGTLGSTDGDRRRSGGGHVLGELTALELPLLAPAVQELHVVEPAELQDPVGVCGEPVVVPAVEEDGGAVVHAHRTQEPGQPRLVHVVATDLRVQVGRPVPRDRAADVTLLVGARVLVDLDHTDRRIVEMLLEPVGVDQHVGLGVLAHRWFPLRRVGRVAPGKGKGRPVRPPERFRVRVGDQCTAARSSRAPRRAARRVQHKRDGIIAPTTPMHRVRIKLELLGRNL